MKFIKTQISLVLPLLGLIFGIYFSLLSNKIISQYEELMKDDYNIIAVSNKELSEDELKGKIKDFASMDMVDAKPVLSRLENELSQKNLDLLKSSLPHFYSIKLSHFSDPLRIENAKKALLGISGISQVETFSKSHNKIYKSLLLSRYISYIFVGVLGFLALLLMLKQIRIWLYEHKERIEIMSLFGASFWLKSGVIYKNAFFSSLLATLIGLLFFALIAHFGLLKSTLAQLDIIMPALDVLNDGAIMLASCLALSFSAASIVMSKGQK